MTSMFTSSLHCAMHRCPRNGSAIAALFELAGLFVAAGLFAIAEMDGFRGITINGLDKIRDWFIPAPFIQSGRCGLSPALT
jgi:hypothetical protein